MSPAALATDGVTQTFLLRFLVLFIRGLGQAQVFSALLKLSRPKLCGLDCVCNEGCKPTSTKLDLDVLALGWLRSKVSSGA